MRVSGSLGIRSVSPTRVRHLRYSSARVVRGIGSGAGGQARIHLGIYKDGWRAGCGWPGPDYATGAANGHKIGDAIHAKDLDELEKTCGSSSTSRTTQPKARTWQPRIRSASRSSLTCGGRRQRSTTSCRCREPWANASTTPDRCRGRPPTGTCSSRVRQFRRWSSRPSTTGRT